MARLDRLATTREIAQLGATIGRAFSYELLHAVSSLDERSLQQGLRQLVEVELLYQRGLPPQATYLFKHALIQDTAYESLLKSKRQQYHQQIAQVLEAQFPDTTETQPELVAHHYTEAGLIENALPYWQQAGERATQRSAYMEAIAHYTKGFELLQLLPDTPERTRQELRLQLALDGPLAPALAGAYAKVGQIEAGLSVVAEALEVVDKTGARVSEAELYRLKGELLMAREGDRLSVVSQRGKAEEAEECFLQAIETARQQQAKSLELRATMNLARLWQQQGKRAEAHNLLSGIYNWFTEGFDTKDLQEAKALLEELSR